MASPCESQMYNSLLNWVPCFMVDSMFSRLCQHGSHLPFFVIRTTCKSTRTTSTSSQHFSAPFPLLGKLKLCTTPGRHVEQSRHKLGVPDNPVLQYLACPCCSNVGGGACSHGIGRSIKRKPRGQIYYVQKGQVTAHIQPNGTCGQSCLYML
jgi:hypothetical protein